MIKKHLLGVIKNRCPHCLEGIVFSSFLKMNTHCAVCGIKYEREQGYFLMGIFFGYLLSFIIAAVTLVILLIFFEPTPFVYIGGASLPLVILSPLIFRFGRLIWLHVDEIIDPRKTAADKAGERPSPHGIDLMLTHQNETEDHFYKRKNPENP